MSNSITEDVFVITLAGAISFLLGRLYEIARTERLRRTSDRTDGVDRSSSGSTDASSGHRLDWSKVGARPIRPDGDPEDVWSWGLHAQVQSDGPGRSHVMMMGFSPEYKDKWFRCDLEAPLDGAMAMVERAVAVILGHLANDQYGLATTTRSRNEVLRQALEKVVEILDGRTDDVARLLAVLFAKDALGFDDAVGGNLGVSYKDTDDHRLFIQRLLESVREVDQAATIGTRLLCLRAALREIANREFRFLDEPNAMARDALASDDATVEAQRRREHPRAGRNFDHA
jgi:hypothetical protein